jgi:outer membrane protein OmpA-like peptidoglycan-associated protein
MAEHPANDNRSTNSPDGREDKNQKFEDLRSILLAPEQKELAGLRRRIESPVARTNDVSTIVAEAIELRRERGGNDDLNKALTPSVEEALRESVRKDPTVLAGALFPVMGPAIRKSIAEAIRSMLESFNQALEHSLSIQGLRWRFESMRTGKPFAEIVLLHSLIFRVEQVFLIHKETSLMLAHCVAPGVDTKDPSLVSGMFSAIQSYVLDSFKATKDDSLDSLQVGDLEVWVEDGPQAILAAVIRGHAPASYRERLVGTIEEIHRDFGEALGQFDGDTTPFLAAEHRLEPLLESHFDPKAAARRKPYWAWVVIAAFLIAVSVWAAISEKNQQKWRKYLEDLRNQKGIAVTSVERSGGQMIVHGLRDPSADDLEGSLQGRGIDPKSVAFDWKLFRSLDLHPAEPAPDRSEIDKLESSLTSTLLTFPLGIAEVDSSEETKFGGIATQIKSLVDKAVPLGLTPSIEVIGHTDTSGTESANQPLSERRAEFVIRKLVDQGVSRDCLFPRGVGTTEPVRAPGALNADHFDRSVTLRIILANSNQHP